MVFTGEDFALGPYTVTFFSRTSIVPLSILILDDDILEGNENFTLTFDSSTLPVNVFLDNDNNQTTVIIFDDDSECTENTSV